MKVLLVQAKNKYRDRFPIHLPNGVLHLAAVLRKKPDVESIKIYDMNVQDPDLKPYREQFEEISMMDWDILGVSGMISAYSCVKQMCAYLKMVCPERPIVLGGLIASTNPDFLMRHVHANCVVSGEGEEIVYDLFKALIEKDTTALSRIPGLQFRFSDRIEKTESLPKGRRPRTGNFDDYAIPSYDLLDIKNTYLPLHAYSTPWLKEYVKRTGKPYDEMSMRIAMPVFLGRGCPYNCVFCYSILDNRPVKMSIPNAFKHLQLLEDNYSVRNFQIMDENFNINKQWVIDFCRENISRGNRYYFTTANRNRANLMDEEMIEWMAKANFYDVSVGVESLDDEILEEMNKKNRSETVMGVLRLLEKHGIGQPHTRCLGGFPSDTWATMWNSVRKGRGLDCKVLFAIVIPFPGTELYHYCLKNGIIKDEEAYWVELHWDEGRRNMTGQFMTLRRLLVAMSTVNDLSELWACCSHTKWYKPWELVSCWKYVRSILNRYVTIAIELFFGFVPRNENNRYIVEDAYRVM